MFLERRNACVSGWGFTDNMLVDLDTTSTLWRLQDAGMAGSVAYIIPDVNVAATSTKTVIATSR